MLVTRNLQKSLHFIDSDDGLCAFDLKRSSRRTIGLQIEGDGQLLVRAPYRVSMREIRTIVRDKQGWIRRKRDEVARENQNLRRRRQQAASHRWYLGETYALRLQRNTQECVELGAATLDVRVRQLEPGHVNRVLEGWYAAQARAVLPDYFRRCEQQLAHLRLGEPELRFRHMRSRWGSCSSQGRITLNTELIKAPPRCIEYIILHELCHLRELNHSARFYALMDLAMPDWRIHQRTLDEIGALF